MSWTVAYQAPLSMEFFRQEHWSWVAISFSRGSLDPGIEPASQARQADSLPWGHQGSPRRPRETSSSPGWSSPPSGHRVSLCRCWQPCLDRLHTSSRKSSGKGHKARDLSEQPFLTRITNGHTQTSGQQSALFKGVCRVTGVFKRVTEEKGTKEDEMVGWHHWLNGHGFGDGQGSLACCSPRGHKELDTTERLNWTEPRRHFHLTVMMRSQCVPCLADREGLLKELNSASQEESGKINVWCMAETNTIL